MDNGLPEDWHEGCFEDSPRNDFIIPKIASHCFEFPLNSIAFLGCATGYIPQKLSELVEVKKFFLIDVDKGRLDFAKSLEFGDTEVSFHHKTIEELATTLKTDLIVISNTLLEFEPDSIFFNSLHSCLEENGGVLVFLPDILEDVVDEYVGGNRFALVDFIKGVRQVEKKDKFTLVKTNFYAHRLINLAGLFLNTGLHLSEVCISDTSPRYYFLKFGRD